MKVIQAAYVLRRGSVEEWPELLKDLKRAKSNVREFADSLQAVKDKLDRGVSLKKEFSLIKDFVKQIDHGKVEKVSKAAATFYLWVSLTLEYADIV